MSFGKIFSRDGNPRTTALKAIAKLNGLNIEYVHTDPPNVTQQYIAEHQPLGKIPSFEGADGLKLFETLSIAFYLAKQDPHTTLIPEDVKAHAQVVQWCSFASHELLPNLAEWWRPTLGRPGTVYNKKAVDAAEVQVKRIMKYLDSVLLHRTYLVGERLTIADLVMAAYLDRGFQYLFDKVYIEAYPNVVRYWLLVRHFKPYLEVMGEPKFIDRRIQFSPPKKEEKHKKEAAPKKEAPPQKPKEAPKKKDKDEDEEEEDDGIPKEKAPKHPLAALPAPAMPIDEWKRQYSNNDTDVALKWFWEHYNPKDYSLWRVDYKYPEDLGLIFQTSNLITGFFNRLDASRKFLFGCLLVLGENNNAAISGAFLVRGDDHIGAFDVAPDWESYDFKKLDPASEADKEFLRDAWTWDKPMGGKPVADGKVFK